MKAFKMEGQEIQIFLRKIPAVVHRRAEQAFRSNDIEQQAKSLLLGRDRREALATIGFVMVYDRGTISNHFAIFSFNNRNTAGALPSWGVHFPAKCGEFGRVSS